jgi:uncharacterized membrane protein
MKGSEATVASAVAGLLLLATLSPGVEAAKDEAPAVEKCYGVAKAGKNDCQTKMSACAGTSKQDAQKDAWISVPKGTCEKIVGGSLQAAAKK